MPVRSISLVWCLLAFLSKNSEVHRTMVEKVAVCTDFPTPMCILSYIQVQ